MHVNIPINKQRSFWSILIIFLRLGLTSFGGPVAHLGYFREEFVAKRKWLDEHTYVEIVALCQFLPGPTSSQVGMVLGFFQKKYLGLLAAWLGFTLPSALFLMFLSRLVSGNTHLIPLGIIHGLKIVVVAVVSQAVWAMAKSICTDNFKICLMSISACIVLLFQSLIWSTLAVIFTSAIVGSIFLRTTQTIQDDLYLVYSDKKIAFFSLILFFTLLFGLPLLQELYPNQWLGMLSTFYRAGSLVFGGGHVVLPLLQSEVIPKGWVTGDTFLTGYGLTQAMPGPLFTFAAYIGSSASEGVNSVWGGLLCLIAIFLPSFLLVVGTLPFWGDLKQNARAKSALMGVNCGVVGILLAALYKPIWISAIGTPLDFCFGLAAFISLMYLKLPPWFVVLATSTLYWISQAIN
jgi:chromate transporter